MISNVEIEIECLSHFKGLKLPAYQTEHSAGVDLQSAEDVTIKKGERKLVATGIKMAIPIGYEGQIRPRSGLSLREGLLVPNSPGTIDSDYRGEVKIILWNLGENDFKINKGDRIAQLVISPIVRAAFQVVAELGITDRNEGGFGHTGVS
ncbi:MAG: deoxyuridine 5'-triphosphate nucleotidohydrolase [Candidatus Margulisbacteria bacterium GWF2_35_9]|nr:MAG: deoxyuridine 5'-triphosphate nucleotidohydrolase [Candidatus Margulisbacteria bacterium GWF2_35_9]